MMRIFMNFAQLCHSEEMSHVSLVNLSVHEHLVVQLVRFYVALVWHCHHSGQLMLHPTCGQCV